MKVSGFKKVGIIAAMAVIGFAFTACGNGANGPEEELPGNGPDGWQGRSPVIQLSHHRIDLGTWASNTTFTGTGVPSLAVGVTIFNLQEYAHLDGIDVTDNANRYIPTVTVTPGPTEPAPPHEGITRVLELEVRDLPGGATPQAQIASDNNHLGVNVSATNGYIPVGPSGLHDFAARGDITFTVNANRTTRTGTTTVQLVLQEVTTRGAGTPSVRTLATAPLTIVLHCDD